MPASPYSHIGNVVFFLMATKPSSILDIGVGNGKMGFIARDLLDVCLNKSYLRKDWKVRIDGIEIYEPYIQDHQRSIYNNIYIGDAFEVIDRLESYDLIIIGDVLAHMEKQKAWLFLDKCALHSKHHILLNLPLGQWNQPDIFENEYERHVSFWDENEIKCFASDSSFFHFLGDKKYGVFFIHKDNYLFQRGEMLLKESSRLSTKGLSNKSLDILQYAQSLCPERAEIINNIGAIYLDRNELDNAIESFQSAIRKNPEFHIAHFNLASSYERKGNLKEAIIHYLKSIKLNPHFYDSAYKLGILYKKIALYDESLIAFDIAVKINPNLDKAYVNMGAINFLKGQYEEAITLFQKAISINNDNADAHWNLALSLLLRGDFKRGWREYEYRWRLKDAIIPKINIPLWDGKTNKGRILIITEQGLGDAIQFIRYVKPLSQRGLQVSVQCQRELKNLFKNIPNLETFTFDDYLPDFDFFSPILTLPYLFETTLETIPCEIPYLFANNDKIVKFQRLIGKNEKQKVGLVWAGKGSHEMDMNRSINLSMLSSLFELKNIEFYSLQKGDASKEVSLFNNIIDLTGHLEDFSDTAGLIYYLDLIITVDTSVAHLAGAMGKKVWILLPFCPDWRWLLDKEDSPWYPTARLFRQKKAGDWIEVIHNVTQELSLFF